MAVLLTVALSGFLMIGVMAVFKLLITLEIARRVGIGGAINGGLGGDGGEVLEEDLEEGREEIELPEEKKDTEK